MAEGFLKTMLPRKFIVRSAGFKPQPIDERAIKVMAEAGIDISQQTSKLYKTLSGDNFDLIITLCDHRVERCQLQVMMEAERMHKSFMNPAQATGTAASQLKVFRNVRDQIKKFCEYIASEIVARK